LARWQACCWHGCKCFRARTPSVLAIPPPPSPWPPSSRPITSAKCLRHGHRLAFAVDRMRGGAASVRIRGLGKSFIGSRPIVERNKVRQSKVSGVAAILCSPGLLVRSGWLTGRMSGNVLENCGVGGGRRLKRLAE